MVQCRNPLPGHNTSNAREGTETGRARRTGEAKALESALGTLDARVATGSRVVVVVGL